MKNTTERVISRLQACLHWKNTKSRDWVILPACLAVCTCPSILTCSIIQSRLPRRREYDQLRLTKVSASVERQAISNGAIKQGRINSPKFDLVTMNIPGLCLEGALRLWELPIRIQLCGGDVFSPYDIRALSSVMMKMRDLCS